MNSVLRRRPEFAGMAFVAAAAAWKQPDAISHQTTRGVTLCEATRPSTTEKITSPITSPSWIRRSLLAPIGIPLPTPRLLTPKDPALKLPKRFIQRRQKDEQRMVQLLEKAPSLRGDPEKIKALGEEVFEVTYGKGVTAQIREDFLLKYGCTGWTDEVLKALVDFCESRGIVEMGAGHGQWARALSDAYENTQTRLEDAKKRKRFDFVLAYDDMSNLPLNTHIYNPYTQPHHEYFGNVRKVEDKTAVMRILQSWACRGRALLRCHGDRDRAGAAPGCVRRLGQRTRRCDQCPVGPASVRW